MTATPIESRCAWRIHAESRAESAKLGYCFHCQQERAFLAVEAQLGGKLAIRSYACDVPTCPGGKRANHS
jgi:hypothetical protein